MLTRRRSYHLPPISWEPRPSRLVLSWCQGVGGRSEFGAACQGAGGSLNMWSTMLTRQSTYHSCPIRGEPRRSSESATPPARQLVSSALASGGWRPDRGWYSGPRCMWVRGHVINDADTTEKLPFTSYIFGTTSQPASSPKFAALRCWIEAYLKAAWGCGYCRVGCGGNLRGSLPTHVVSDA